jgi:HEAT repeat protein
MNSVQKWLRLYGSENRIVRCRAAKGLLKRSNEVPLQVLLSILDTLSDEGLGAATERALKLRRDKELASEMISRLKSSNDFILEVACEVLGALGDRKATSHLLGILNDPRLLVRRAAASALASLRDPTSVSELKKQYALQKSDPNMELAIGSALRELAMASER